MRLVLAPRARAGVLVAGVVLLGVLPLWTSDYVLGILTMAFYFGVFGMSWDLLFGFAGEVNFGPTFLTGIGAYTAGMLNAYASWPMWACMAAGALAAVLAGALLALPALRLRGPYFGLVTLVSVLLLQQLIVVFAGTTGGEIGLTVPDVLAISTKANYYYGYGLLVISGALLLGYARSPSGLILEATGQDPLAAQAMGFNVTKHKLFSFCVSAFFSGLAGAMLIFYLGTASVSTVVAIAVTVQIIIAAVLGGRRTVLGAALGSMFLIVMGEALRDSMGELNTFAVAVLALVVLLFFPDGFLGYLMRRGGGR